MVLLVYVIYLLCTITLGHPNGWPLRLREQDLAEKTGQQERIPSKLEHKPQATPTPFIQEDEPAQQKKRRGKRNLDQEIQNLASKFRSDKVQQCCHDGRKQFDSGLDCNKTPNQLDNKWGKRCHDAFKSCCFHAMEYYVKPVPGFMEEIEFVPEKRVLRKFGSKDVHLLRAYNHSIKLDEIVSPRRFSLWDATSDFRLQTLLDGEINDMATKYENYDVMLCCHRGKTKYLDDSECMRIVEEPQCSAAFQDCCSHTREFFQKPRRVGLDIHLQSPTGMLTFKIVENSDEMVTAETTKSQMQEEAESEWNMLGPQKTLVEILIAVASMYQTFTMKECCCDGYIHYLVNSECMRKPEEDEEKKKRKREWLCHATFQTCCFRAQDYLQKPNENLNMNLTIFEGKGVSMKASEYEVQEKVNLAEHEHVEEWGKKEESLKEEMRIFASDYKSKEKKRCCHDGYQHYIMNVECVRRLDEKETEATRKCYDAFRDCCFHAQSYLWYFPSKSSSSFYMNKLLTLHM